jgi:hypothetical protein
MRSTTRVKALLLERIRRYAANDEENQPSTKEVDAT